MKRRIFFGVSREQASCFQSGSNDFETIFKKTSYDGPFSSCKTLQNENHFQRVASTQQRTFPNKFGVSQGLASPDLGSFLPMLRGSGSGAAGARRDQFCQAPLGDLG